MKAENRLRVGGSGRHRSGWFSLLIGLGVMFLLGDYNREIFRNVIPVALIAIGVWKGIQVWERTAR